MNVAVPSAYAFDVEVPAHQVVELSRVEELKGFVDFACRSDQGDLLLLGWVFDPKGVFGSFSLLREKRRVLTADRFAGSPIQHLVRGAHLSWFARPDVARAMAEPEARGDRAGFLLVMPRLPPNATVAITLTDGHHAPLPFVALENLADVRDGFHRHWNHLSGRVYSALRSALDDSHALTQLAAQLELADEPEPHSDALAVPIEPAASTSKFAVDAAIDVGTGVVLVGWAVSGEGDDRTLQISTETEFAASVCLLDDTAGSVLVPILRPDLKGSLTPAQFARGWHGFAFYWPNCRPGSEAISLRLSGSAQPAQKISLLPLDDRAVAALVKVWVSAGAALRVISRGLASEEFRNLLDRAEAARLVGVDGILAACDQAILLNNRVLILNGWVTSSTAEITEMSLIAGGSSVDIKNQLTRYPRPDLFEMHPWSRQEPIGFLLVLTDSELLGCDVGIQVATRSGTQLLQPEILVWDWLMLVQFLGSHPAIGDALLPQLLAIPDLEPDAPRLAARSKWLYRGLFSARLPHLTAAVEHPESLIAAVDRGYPMGESGLLIFGWKLTPVQAPIAVKIRGAEGQSVDVTERMFPLLRADVASSYAARFSDVTESCGFVCLAPVPTREGEARAICFDFGELGEVWLNVPTPKPDRSGKALIRELIGMVPAPERMLHKLYELFDGGLGAAIASVDLKLPVGRRPLVHQFGPAQAHAETSVIVPLYGRFDFLRHQLAQFADDADFRDIDLIYVVDDPRILPGTLELAARYQPLFKVSFRVVTYEHNLGFAGANNVGVSFASGDYVVLLNSDAIPQEAGWVSVLRNQLESLPQAGAVGPLLQFGDGSIQHAGMYPRRDAKLPGFMLNSHKHMGMSWQGEMAPSEHPMLTAACMMLRKQDYENIGGFDEGYVIGDFEDSDLCLRLRKLGKTLWLVPEAKLWHLERLSQNAAEIIDQRQMITLFNGWRYTSKIRSGELPDPTQWEAAR